VWISCSFPFSFGAIGKDIAKGLSGRHDHGTQYLADDFHDEIAFWGIESSPAFVRAPEGNGCAERIIRTLKEQLLRVPAFDTVEELRLALIAWHKIYYERWLIERHGHRCPAQVRSEHYVQSCTNRPHDLPSHPSPGIAGGTRQSPNIRRQSKDHSILIFLCNINRPNTIADQNLA